MTLGVIGEAVLPLAGLDPAGDGSVLLLERARRVQPALPTGPGTDAVAAQICALADGLPLAIELAAAHARALPLTAIRDGMADRIGFLTGPPAEGRHRSLVSSLDWSVGLVSDRARSALRALSVLEGRFPVDAAVAVAGRAALEELVDHSLVRFDPVDGRYLLLDTVREYAATTRRPGETRDARARLLAWATTFARDVRAELEHGDRDAVGRVELADAAVRCALEGALEPDGDPVAAAGVAEDLAFGWSLRGRCGDGLGPVQRLVAALDPVPAGLRWAHAFLAFYVGDMDTSLAAAAEAATAVDTRVRARALILTGMAQAFTDPAAAEPVLVAAADAAAAAGDDWGQVEAVQCQAYTHLFRGQVAEAVARADAVVTVLDRLGHGQLRAWDAAIRADAAESRGQYAEAEEQGWRGLRLAVAVGEPVSGASALLPLLRALVATGRDPEAARMLDDGLRFLDTHPGLGTTEAGLLAAAIVASTGPPEAAAQAAQVALEAGGQLPHQAAESALLLGVARLRLQDSEAARTAARTAAGWAGALGHRGLAAAATLVAAVAARDLRGTRDLPGSAPAYDALAELHALGLRPRVADALDLVAVLAHDAARASAAAHLHASAAALREELGAPPSPLAQLLTPGADEPRPGAEGSRMSSADAVAYALRSRGRRGRPRSGWDSLTPTELQVVELVATGRSNSEIGTRLLVSAGTVRTHLRSVFAKLDVTTRAELAARAVEAGRAGRAGSSADRQMFPPRGVPSVDRHGPT